ncbi:MAG: apolipoprotein N-acyltransferase, partial [Rhodobacteraceae bacterium]|nr:apolipoprotein N-acyltransferase [Paracoccaceae bacterium]
LLEDAGFVFDEARAASGNVPMVVGIQRAEGPLYFNSLVALDHAGAVIATYNKHHLVPFGEYIPFGDVMAHFGISAFAAKAGNGYSAGPGPQVLDLGRGGKVLPLICYEAVFPQDLRTGKRPDWMVQITNDSWFGTLAGPWQHLAQAQLRAIEQGLPLLRAANTGVTAVIDARGRVLQSLGLDVDGWLDADVPPALPPTLYARTGDLPVTMLLLGCILSLLVHRRPRVC